MKAYYDIQQGTEDWFKIKWGKVGGTLSKGLFVETDNLANELLSEITEDFELDEDSYSSKDMTRGVELEPMARQALIDYTGINFINAGWLECEENKLLGISPDGISECETITAEIKCPAAKKHIATLLSNEIPSDNIHQCLHYFVINPKLKTHYFCSFRPESIKRMFVKELTLESVINLGTKAKPVSKTIAEWVKIAHQKASELQIDIDAKLEKLNF